MHEQVGKYRASDKKMRQGRACVNGLKQAIFAVYVLTGPVPEGGSVPITGPVNTG